MRMLKDTIEPPDRSAPSGTNQQRFKRGARSPRLSCSITTGSDRTKGEPVGMSPLASPFPVCRPCLPFQNELTLIVGWPRSITRCFCVASVGMAVRALDLAPYSIGPRMAGCQVLLQVETAERQLVVWHADEVIKTLPVKGLVGQEMTINDYLKYIQQEALAYERRFSAR